MRVRTVGGREVSARADGIRQVYADAFCAPPWNEDASAADRYTDRLATDTARPGFAAAVALDTDGTVTGFATAWTIPAPFPDYGTFPAVAAALGPRRVADWLCGAMKVDELAVGPRARGAGIGAALLSTVTAAAVDGRCWLLTSLRAEPALRFYRRAGWHRVPVAIPGEAALTVLLGPGHPGAVDLDTGGEQGS
ncbi:GNAT family N-acetyltransferase [Streptomyces sp. NBC_01754]|uniref:GNAT family N-acetyltransferase n=1 Tax=Streptomyces sp. NBC_01754 TaxID=2975930 RepID=UPI002DD9E719|nr:GNAT family N-acetyltransferase [Streptomyces sp. NBC_01754]WSC92505.1 GNAT family N-acetyltransferase [Streptomyces sp. NBC_01754]